VETEQCIPALAVAQTLAKVFPMPAPDSLSTDQARALAKEAYIYGFPIVDNYRIMYTYTQDPADKEYKGPVNHVLGRARLFTSEDRTVQTPNSDTPYCMLVADLRAGPLVLTLPAVEKDRYMSVQLIDLYTFNFDYLGTRTTGNGGGRYLLVGPKDAGMEPPEGIDKVLRSETELVFGLYRTQIYGPEDLENVKTILTGYTAEPLWKYLQQSPPEVTPTPPWLKPLTPAAERSSVKFFDVLQFALTFCPVHPDETELRERFEAIHLGEGQTPPSSLPAEIQAALQEGMVEGQQEINEKRKVTPSASELVGSREFLDGNFLNRAVGTQVGIYANSKEEAYYGGWAVEADGKTVLDTSRHRYTLRFATGQLPPAHSFWSVTMYDFPAQLLVANPINRYLINSPMLPSLKKDADGGLTLLIQKDSPGADQESNWLPAPHGRPFLILRAYLPKPEILNGTWKLPPLQRAD
jgi:hypothetical protein